MSSEKDSKRGYQKWTFAVSWKSIGLILLGIVINLAGRKLAQRLSLPFWMDSIGTLTAAISLGPLAGALTGGLTNLVLGIGSPVSLWYAIVNMAVGVTVGYFFPREKESDMFHVIATAMFAGFVAVVISTPLNVVLYSGYTGNIWGDGLVDMLARDIRVRFLCGLLGEAFVDMPDKVCSVLFIVGIRKLFQLLKKNRKKAG